MQFDDALKILANPVRRTILLWLKEPDVTFAGYPQLFDFEVYGVCASHIQAKAELSQPATSLYLKALQEAGFVTATKVGRWTYYQRNDEMVRAVCERLTRELIE